MRVSELKRHIKYWPDDGDVYYDDGTTVELEPEEIRCVASEPAWAEMRKKEKEDLTRTIDLFERVLDHPDLIDKDRLHLKLSIVDMRKRLEELNEKESQ